MPTVLAINPGSATTKLGLFRDGKEVITKTLEHSGELHAADVSKEHDIEVRRSAVVGFLRENGIDISTIDAIACRGGILPPLESGTYVVDDEMVDYLIHRSPVDHPSNRAAPLGAELSMGKVPVFITDPVSVDEFWELSRISGIPQIERRSLLHALNMKAAARRVAQEMGKDLTDLNFVIVHLGGGISVGLQMEGRMVDVNNANDEGPFSPNRSGELPVGDVVEMAFSGKHSEKQLISRYTKQGGLFAYTGTDDLRKAFELSQNDNNVSQVIAAMAYQIAKEIGGMCAVAGGEIDAVVLTGGMAYSERFVEMIRSYVSRFALVTVEPGENELLSLVEGAERVLNGTERAKKLKEGVVRR